MNALAMPAGRGAFVTFEGIDGAGKSTHVEWFAQRLRDRGHRVLVTREPGGTAVAESLRALMLNQSMSPTTELLLAFAARVEHVHERIAPALADGTWVVCDRFTDSTFAYQGGGRGVDWSLIHTLESAVIADLQPDLTVWFDVPAEVAAQRRAAVRVSDRFESEGTAFFEQVRQGYLRRRQEHPARFQTINALLSIDEIRAKLEEIIISNCF